MADETGDVIGRLERLRREFLEDVGDALEEHWSHIERLWHRLEMTGAEIPEDLASEFADCRHEREEMRRMIAARRLNTPELRN